MEGRCLPCNSPFHGEDGDEEEEEGEGEEESSSNDLWVRTVPPELEENSSSNALWVRTVPLDLDLPRKNSGDGDGNSSRLLANGAHHRREHSRHDQSKQGHQDGHPERTRYTSLRDLLPLPPALPSHTAAARLHGGEITIRNRLVKQAAYAYLQPAAGASSPGSRRSRGCLDWFRWEAGGCLGIVGARIVPAVRRTLGRLLAGLRRRTVRDR